MWKPCAARLNAILLFFNDFLLKKKSQANQHYTSHAQRSSAADKRRLCFFASDLPSNQLTKQPTNQPTNQVTNKRNEPKKIKHPTATFVWFFFHPQSSNNHRIKSDNWPQEKEKYILGDAARLQDIFSLHENDLVHLRTDGASFCHWSALQTLPRISLSERGALDKRKRAHSIESPIFSVRCSNRSHRIGSLNRFFSSDGDSWFIIWYGRYLESNFIFIREFILNSRWSVVNKVTILVSRTFAAAWYPYPIGNWHALYHDPAARREARCSAPTNHRIIHQASFECAS